MTSTIAAFLVLKTAGVAGPKLSEKYKIVFEIYINGHKLNFLILFLLSFKLLILNLVLLLYYL